MKKIFMFICSIFKRKNKIESTMYREYKSFHEANKRYFDLYNEIMNK